MLPFIIILVGVIFLLRELIPWSQAQASGVIHRRGHNRQVVRRSEDPEPFRTLSRNRLKASLLGVGLIAAGAVWVLTNILAMSLSPEMQENLRTAEQALQ